MDKNNLHINTQQHTSSVLRLSAMFYSVVCYAIGVIALIYLILFIADLFVPVTINQGAGYAPKIEGFTAVLWNIGVITVWGLQHSIMARPAFKKIWTRVVPIAVETQHVSGICCTGYISANRFLGTNARFGLGFK